MTALITQATRWGAQISLEGNALTVALDAQVNNAFTLPAGIGSVLLRSVSIGIEDLTGAYVAPTPSNDGIWLYIADSRSITIVDSLDHGRFVHYGTDTGRPTLGYTKEFHWYRLMRQDENLYIRAPIIAGVGVTGSLICRIMCVRFETA